MKTLTINQPVSVSRLGFRQDMQAYPRAIDYDGQRYEFIDRGLRYTVRCGGRATPIFSLTDGQRQFWLRDSGGGAWMLLGMSIG